MTASCYDSGMFSLELTPHPSLLDSLFFIPLSFFFFKAASITVNNPFILMVLKAFSAPPRRPEKFFRKRKGEKKILLSLENSLVCYRAFLTLHCSADSTINRLSLEIKTYIFKKYLFNVAFSSTLIFLSVLDRKCEKMKR